MDEDKCSTAVFKAIDVLDNSVDQIVANSVPKNKINGFFQIDIKKCSLCTFYKLIVLK